MKSASKIQNKIQILSVLWIIFLLAGCQSLPRIHALYDETVDLGRYQTFGFHPKRKIEGDEYESLATRYIKAAITNEMQKRGYRLVDDDPGLWVNFNVHLKDKVQITSIPTTSYYYTYRHGYSVWIDYPFYNARVNQYTEGTLNIDIVDRRSKKLVWEGIAIGRLRKKTFDNLEAKVNEVIELIFEKYPN